MNKVILITGAGTGIGAETARQLAEGNTLFLHYNQSAEAVKQVAEDVEKRGGKAILLQADLMTEKACEDLVAALAEKTDHLDVLINNAGGMIAHQNVGELEWDLMERVFALNTFSAMKLTSLCVPLLRKSENDPNVVNLSSIVVRHGGPTATIYGAAKGAVDTFTRGAAKDLAPYIRVNAVAPGVIDTPFHKKVSTPEKMAAWAANNPLKRNGEPIHIALAIKMLTENSFINGEVIDVNGGQTMH